MNQALVLKLSNLYINRLDLSRKPKIAQIEGCKTIYINKPNKKEKSTTDDDIVQE